MHVSSKIAQILCMTCLYDYTTAHLAIRAPKPARLSDEVKSSSWLDVSDFDFAETKAPQYVVDHWDEEKACHPEYFRMGPQKFNESRALDWYKNIFLKDWELHAAEANLDETTYFGERFLGVDNYRCQEQAGVCEHQSCYKIVDRVKSQFKGQPMDVVLEEARRIRYIGLHLEELTRTGKQVRDALHRAQTDLLGETARISEDFFPKADKAAENWCFWSKFALQTGLQIATIAITVGVGAAAASSATEQAFHIAEGIDKEFSLAQTAAERMGQDISKITKISSTLGWQKTNAIKNSVEGQIIWSTLGLAEAFVMRAEPKLIEAGFPKPLAGNMTHEEVMEGIDELSVGLSEGGLCSNVGAGPPDERFTHLVAFNHYVTRHFMDLRKQNLEAMKSMLHNRDPGNSALLPVFGKMAWSDKFKDQMSLLTSETDMVQYTLEKMISYAWKAGHCYLKCEDLTDNPKRLHEWCGNPKHGKRDHRICHGSQVCQAQCWTSQIDGNHERMLFGANALHKFQSNITLEGSDGMLEKALRNWVQKQLKGIYDASGGTELGVATIHPEISAELGVCWNNRGDLMMNFENRPNARFRNINKNSFFPASCGQWGNMQTVQFMNSIGMGVGTAEYMSGKHKETFQRTIPHVLDRMSGRKKLTPIESFLEYCNHGIQYPPKKGIIGYDGNKPRWLDNKDFIGFTRHYVRMKRGPHPMCGKIREETAGMTLQAANEHFCNGRSDATEWVMSKPGEMKWIERVERDTKGLMNHFDQCRKRYPEFVKDGKKEGKNKKADKVTIDLNIKIWEKEVAQSAEMQELREINSTDYAQLNSDGVLERLVKTENVELSDDIIVSAVNTEAQN